MSTENTEPEQSEARSGEAPNERLVINQYLKLKLGTWVLMIVLAWPISYLFFSVNLGWATLPTLLTVGFIYGYLWCVQQVAHEKYKETEDGKAGL